MKTLPKADATDDGDPYVVHCLRTARQLHAQSNCGMLERILLQTLADYMGKSPEDKAKHLAGCMWSANNAA
jgi:hypothetical protein